MNRKFSVLLCTAALAGAAAPVSGALGAKSKGASTVTVRVEGLKRTLLAPIVVHVPSSGSITKGGTPTGACSASSGAGALDVATKHNWDGKYSASVKDIFITRILGDSESGTKEFWSIYVNNVSATTGACGIKPHRGDQLLFAVVPVTGTAFPLALKATAVAKVKHAFKVTVLGYDAKGKTKPLTGATVSSGKLTVKTNSHGVVRMIAPNAPGKLVITASKTGYVRAAPLTVRVTP